MKKIIILKEMKLIIQIKKKKIMQIEIYPNVMEMKVILKKEVKIIKKIITSVMKRVQLLEII